MPQVDSLIAIAEDETLCVLPVKRSCPRTRDFGMSPRFRPTMVVLPKMETNHGCEVTKLLQAGLSEGHDTVKSNVCGLLFCQPDSPNSIYGNFCSESGFQVRPIARLSDVIISVIALGWQNVFPFRREKGSIWWDLWKTGLSKPFCFH